MMKPKKIPRCVRLWLLVIGFWGGSITTLGLIAFYITGSILGLYLLLIIVIGSVALWYFLTWKYRKTLEEWGVVEPKKEKKKQ